MSRLESVKLRLAELQAELGRYLDNIPGEMENIPHWVLSGLKKEPINPHTGRLASSKKPDQWGTLGEAARALKTNVDAIGVAFCFTEADPYVVVDLDHCITKGKLHPKAKEIVKLLDSYTELSISGEGLHIVVRAAKRGKRCIYKGYFGTGGNVEIYDGQPRKFMTLTGKCLCAWGAAL